MSTNKFSWAKVAKQLLGKKAVQKINDANTYQNAVC